jgi:hypothetical protein
MLRFFPIISNCRKGMCVLWEDAQKAFQTYAKAFPGQTIEDIFAGGGFGVEEFVYFYHGFTGPETGDGWPTDICMTCKGQGEVVLSEHGGMPDLCGKCLGVGALLPKEHPGVKV